MYKGYQIHHLKQKTMNSLYTCLTNCYSCLVFWTWNSSTNKGTGWSAYGSCADPESSNVWLSGYPEGLHINLSTLW